jgi:hypothetical protein
MHAASFSLKEGKKFYNIDAWNALFLKKVKNMHVHRQSSMPCIINILTGPINIFAG